MLVWLLVHEERVESTMLGSQAASITACYRAAGALSRAEERFK